MILQRLMYGFPGGVVVTDIPPSQQVVRQIWHDEFNVTLTDFNLSQWDVPAVAQGVSGQSMQLEASAEVGVVETAMLDQPIATHTDSNPDAQSPFWVIDFDAFGTLEMGGEFDGVFDGWSLAAEPSPESVPLYAIVGQTVDYTSLAPIAGCAVRVWDVTGGRLYAMVTSDAGGNYSVPIFDQRNYLLTAHNGQDPAGVTRADVRGT